MLSVSLLQKKLFPKRCAKKVHQFLLFLFMNLDLSREVALIFRIVFVSFSGRYGKKSYHLPSQ